MTKISLKKILLCSCLIFFACKDFKCKDITSESTLRHYSSSDRIEKINKEITSLVKKESDKKARGRLGDLHEQLATIYLDKEDMTTSLSNINKAFEYGRNTPYLSYIAGIVYGNMGAKSGSKDEIAKAEMYYRQAIDLKKDYNDAWYSLAILLFYYKKEQEEPIKILENIYTKSRSNYRVRFALGRVYYDSGRKEDALYVYKDLQMDLEKLPNSPMTKEYLQICDENIKKIRDGTQGNK